MGHRSERDGTECISRSSVNRLSCDSCSAPVQFGGGQSKPEFTVDLKGGSVEWASKDKSSKKHVLEVRESLNKSLLL